MGIRHIPVGLFEDVFWDTADHFTLIDNFAAYDNYELVVNTVSQLWNSTKNPKCQASGKPNCFTQQMLEICALSGGNFKYILSSTDYTPCWLILQVLLEIQQLLNAMVVKGFYRTSPPDKTEYEPPDDDNYYDMKFPDWFSEAILKDVNDGLSLDERLEKACALYDDNKTTMLNFTECVECNVLKPNTWILRRLGEVSAKKPSAVADINKYRGN